MVTVKLSSQLSSMAGGARSIEVEATTLAGVFDAIDVKAPMLRSQIFEESGRLRQFVGLFLDGRQVMDLDDGEVRRNSQVLVVCAVAGG